MSKNVIKSIMKVGAFFIENFFIWGYIIVFHHSFTYI